MVTTDVNTVTYNGNGSRTAFPFTFKIQDASEINLQLVYTDGTVTDITSDFYVDTVNSTVHYPGYAPGSEPAEADQPAPVQTGQKLTIWRDVPMTQEADLGDKWPFEEIENGLDKLTMICQQIYSYTNRKLDAALNEMFQLAGIVTDSGKLQHITDQYNAIDANAAAAAESEENAAASATAAANSKASAQSSATNAANSASSASVTAQQLIEYLATKEEITAPAVDPTLTISGAAADAKVTGDVTRKIKNSIEDVEPYNVVTADMSWDIGFINTANGNSQSGTVSIRSNASFYPVGTIIDIGAGYQVQVYKYNKTYSYPVEKAYSVATPFMLAETAKYRFCIKKDDGSTVTDEEVNTMVSALSVTLPRYRWEIEDNAMFSFLPVEYDVNYLSFSGIYNGTGNINTGSYYLFGTKPLPKWVSRVSAPTDYELEVFGYNNGSYIGVWDGVKFRKTSTMFYASDVDITPAMQQYDLYIQIHKKEDTVFDSKILHGIMMETAYKSLLPVEKTVTATVLGYDMNKTFGVGSAYATLMKQTIDTWMEAYQGDAKKIPFIVCTDQHGRLTLARKKIFDLLSYLVNWDEVSAFLQLGDTITDHWEDNNEFTNPILKNTELETALKCLSGIPADKQLTMWGNHDTWYNGALPTEVSGVLPSYATLNPYFKESGLRTVRLPDNSNLKVVYDDYYKVKYVCVADWDYADKNNGGPKGKEWYWVSKAHWEWIIAELTKNDGYDVVIVSHVPLVMGTERAINPITQEPIPAAATPIRFIHYTSLFDKIWYDRKMKLAGSINVNGDVVNYDFTQCESPCYCALAGHTHYNGVDRVYAADGLLQVAFNWFNNDTLHFGIIDRANQKVKVWQLSGGTTSYVADWETDF